MQIEEKIIEVTKKHFNLSTDEIKIINRLKGGMSNYTYLVEVNNTPYVVRIIGDNGEVIVQPKNEFKHLKLVEKMNITSKTIYFDEDNGDKISEYIEGTILSQKIENEDIIELSNILKDLHQTKIIGEDYQLKDRLRRYECLLNKTPDFKYYELKLMWLKLYDEVYIFSKKVFCHGDCQRSNLIKTDTGIKLLDFEFSGMNDPYYDIASFGNISFDDSISLLYAYLDNNVTKEDLNKLRFYRMYQVLQWHIVAKYKHQVGLSEKLGLPFDKIAEKYLNMAEELYKLMME